MPQCEGSEVYVINAQKAEQAHAALLSVSGLSAEAQAELKEGVLPTDLPCFKANLEREAVLRPKLLPIVEARIRQVELYASQLRLKYTSMQRSWEAALPRKERERDSRLQRKLHPGFLTDDAVSSSGAAITSANGGNSSSSTGGAPGRLNSRALGSSRRDRSFGSFDVVRSEEEMNAVIAQLAAEEKRERSDTWIATQCARDTPMILEPVRQAHDRTCLSVRLPSRLSEVAIGNRNQLKA